MIFPPSDREKLNFDNIYKLGVNLKDKEHDEIQNIKSIMIEKVKALCIYLFYNGCEENDRENLRSVAEVTYALFGKLLNKSDPLQIDDILSSYDVFWKVEGYEYLQKLQDKEIYHFFISKFEKNTTEFKIQIHGRLKNLYRVHFEGIEMGIAESQLYLAVQRCHLIYQEFLGLDTLSETRKRCYQDYSIRSRRLKPSFRNPKNKYYLYELPRIHSLITRNLEVFHEETFGKEFYISAAEYYVKLKLKLEGRYYLAKIYSEDDIPYFFNVLKSFYDKFILGMDTDSLDWHYTAEVVHFIHPVFLKKLKKSEPESTLEDLLAKNEVSLKHRKLIHTRALELSSTRTKALEGDNWKTVRSKLEIPKENALRWISDSLENTSEDNASRLFESPLIDKVSSRESSNFNIPTISVTEYSPRRPLSARLQQKKLSSEQISSLAADLRISLLKRLQKLRELRAGGGLYKLTLWVEKKVNPHDENPTLYKDPVISNYDLAFVDTPDIESKDKSLITLPSKASDTEKTALILNWISKKDIPHNAENEVILAKIKVKTKAFQPIIDFHKSVESFFINGILFARSDEHRKAFVRNFIMLVNALYEDENYHLLHATMAPINGMMALSRLNVIQEAVSRSKNQICFQIFEENDRFKTYREKFQNSTKAIPYFGEFFSNLEFSQRSGFWDYSNLTLGFQFEASLFSKISEEEIEEEPESEFLQEILKTPPFYMGSDALWEMSYKIQPSKNTSLVNENQDEDSKVKSNFIEIDANLFQYSELPFDDIILDLNRKTAFIYSALSSSLVPDQQATMIRIQEVCLFYKSIQSFLRKVIQTSEIGGNINSTLENILTLAEQTLKQRNALVLAAIWHIIRSFKVTYCEFKDWKKRFQSLETKVSQIKKKQVINKKSPYLPYPFFLNKFPINKAKKVDIDDYLFNKFNQLITVYINDKEKGYLDLTARSIKTSILDCLKQEKRTLINKRKEKTPLFLARSTSLRESGTFTPGIVSTRSTRSLPES